MDTNVGTCLYLICLGIFVSIEVSLCEHLDSSTVAMPSGKKKRRSSEEGSRGGSNHLGMSAASPSRWDRKDVSNHGPCQDRERKQQASMDFFEQEGSGMAG